MASPIRNLFFMLFIVLFQCNRLACNEIAAHLQRDYGSLLTRLRLVFFTNAFLLELPPVQTDVTTGLIEAQIEVMNACHTPTFRSENTIGSLNLRRE